MVTVEWAYLGEEPQGVKILSMLIKILLNFPKTDSLQRNWQKMPDTVNAETCWEVDWDGFFVSYWLAAFLLIFPLHNADKNIWRHGEKWAKRLSKIFWAFPSVSPLLFSMVETVFRHFPTGLQKPWGALPSVSWHTLALFYCLIRLKISAATETFNNP